MKNPLRKRLLREIREDLGKYITLFLFLTVTIGFISGFLVADGSMKTAYKESFTKYNIEDGHFELAAPADQTLLAELEDKGVSVYPLFYTEKQVAVDDTLRIYANREEINKADVLAGTLPQSDNEIAIDRLYAENNDLTVNDHITIHAKRYRICGLVALSDYSALFQNNADMMFDASNFGVALVTEDAFSSLATNDLHYAYAWSDDAKGLSHGEQSSVADSLLDVLKTKAAVKDFVKQGDNQAITFSGEDMGSDRVMYLWMMYIVMFVLAFIFAVTTRNTIEQEAAVIGTLRASGYNKAELIRHYLALPLLSTVAAALCGNLLGYTVFKNMVAYLYYHSYSLPSYVTRWNGDAFLLTTAVPGLIILVVNLLVLWRALSLPPLAFLRRELRSKKRSRVLKLPPFPFLARFRLRILIQNKGAYLTLLAGIILANVLLLFGMMMSPLLEHYKADILNSQIAGYQYILKAPVETAVTGAEKYAATTLKTADSGEEITVYGIASDSAYLPKLGLPATAGDVLVSDGYLAKYGLGVGDTITLKERYTKQSYDFTIAGSYDYPAALTVFMSAANFNKTFDKDDSDFSGYFSDAKLDGIPAAAVAAVITGDDLTLTIDQLDDSLGSFFPLFSAFAAVLYMLMIYLLAKLVIEKNSFAISMVKILGYGKGEIRRLYHRATTVVVVISLLLSLPLCTLIIREIYYGMMQRFHGWLPFYIDPVIYPEMFCAGIVLYTVIALVLTKKMEKIPLSQALKSDE